MSSDNSCNTACILCITFVMDSIQTQLKVKMSSDEDEDALALLQIINLRHQRQFWVHPRWKKKKKNGGMLNSMEKLKLHPDKFQTLYRMKIETYYILMEKLRSGVAKRWTKFREPIDPEERMLITLRYFASGSSFKALSDYFNISPTSIRRIVHETSQVIWKLLQPEYMPSPTTDKWLEIASGFYAKWKLPNCIGAVGEKRIRLQCPPRSRLDYYFERNSSKVLQGVVDADGVYICIDVGELEKTNYGGRLKESSYGNALAQSHLNIPEPSPLPGEEISFPFYFIGGEAYALTNNFMTPYACNQLTNERKIFNDRLSRSCKSVGCSFEMLASKFELLQRPIHCNFNKIDVIIQAVCVLHNFIHVHDGKKPSPALGNIITGRTVPESTQLNTAELVRDHLTKYMTKSAPIPRQQSDCV